jgi:predicted DNA-binding ribbon-helix-helix protein
MLSGPVKRSITIAGHETSVTLEPIFWDGLAAAATELGLPINALVARIDAQRIEAAQPPNLSSALRVWLYAHARTRSMNADETLETATDAS